MKSNRIHQLSARTRILGMLMAFACAVSLTGCVEGTPLEGTPVEGPLNTLGELLEGPLSKASEFVSGLFDGPSVADARAAKAAETPAALTADQLVREGYLTVGLDTTATSAPFVIVSDGTKLSGIDIDVASAIAGRLGLKVAFVQVEGVDAPLAAGACDIVMSASADRVNTATVLGSYYESAAAFFHKGPEGTVTVADLEGKKVGVQEGSVSQSILADTGLTMEQSSYFNLNSAFDALNAGEVDYVLCDAYPGAFLASTYEGISFAGVLNAPSAWGIAAATDKADLQLAVKEALDTITVNGEMDVIRMRWLGGMPAVTIDEQIADVPSAGATTEESGEAQDGSSAGANAVTVGD